MSRKIYNRVVMSMDTWEVLEEDSFEYDGPVALCVETGGGDPDDPEGMGADPGTDQGGEFNGSETDPYDPSEKPRIDAETQKFFDDLDRGNLDYGWSKGLKDFVEGVFAGGGVLGLGLGTASVAKNYNTAKVAAEKITDNALKEEGWTQEQIDHYRDITGPKGLSEEDKEHFGGEGYTVSDEGYVVGGGETKEISVEDLLAESYENRPTPTIQPPVFDQGGGFSTPAWDAYVAEFLGTTDQPGYAAALTESAAFQREQAEGLLGAVTEATGRYTGLLDSLVDAAKTGTGIFTPLEVSVAGQEMKFVPRASRELAAQGLDIAREQRDAALLPATTAYETAVERDPMRARLGYLDVARDVTKDYTADQLKAQELADVSSRGFGALYNEAQRNYLTSLAASEQQRQFDLEFAQRQREFEQTGELREREIEQQEPGFINYLIGGATLATGLSDLWNT